MHFYYIFHGDRGQHCIMSGGCITEQVHFQITFLYLSMFASKSKRFYSHVLLWSIKLSVNYVEVPYKVDEDRSV